MQPMEQGSQTTTDRARPARAEGKTLGKPEVEKPRRGPTARNAGGNQMEAHDPTGSGQMMQGSGQEAGTQSVFDGLRTIYG